jgi:NADPH-dependent glutamate synthase beta subunit-like oxidoreductase
MHNEKNPFEMTRPPDLKKARRTGATRTERPVYIDRLPPCNAACPAGENIQAWLSLAQEEKIEEAWRELVKNNPLPAVHGRVCYHPCEDHCNRMHIDATVSIHAVERFLGDTAVEQGWQIEPGEPTGKRVLVVGAGPSGLSAAYHLARLGHEVEIHEAGPLAGGMLHFGIPKYRLPRDILDAEIKRIENMGVKIVLNHMVKDVIAERDEGGFDAVFVAVGAHLSRRTDIPARDAGKVYDALSFLKDVESGEQPLIGRRVAIYGGGNTAMDAARTAKRLGATEALIIYRRNRDKAPAHSFEIDEAEEEGIKIHWLRTIKQIDQTTFTVEKMALNAEGWPEPTGEVEELEADSLIMALGQDTDTEFLKQIPGIEFKRDATVVVNDQMMTGHPGLFAGGDMVPDERTVTIAVGHGKKAARFIDAYLHGKEYVKPPKHEGVSHDMLHVWYYSDARQREQSRIDTTKRTGSFEEVVGGLDQEAAVYEARRCLSCGNCFECDGCYGACPEDAVIKLGPGKRYKYDYDLCTGCAVCFEQCPCAAIKMVPEKV